MATTTIPPTDVGCSKSFDRVKFRRGYYWEFWTANPILKHGEPSYTIDNGYNCIRVGDGVTAWRDLDCFCFSHEGCEIVTTTPGPPPPPKGDDCNPMLCVAFIDETCGPGGSAPNGQRNYFTSLEENGQLFNTMMEAFPNRLFFLLDIPMYAQSATHRNFPAFDSDGYLVNPNGPFDVYGNDCAFTNWWNYIDRKYTDLTLPTKRVFSLYYDLGKLIPKARSEADEQAEYIANGGAWPDILAMINKAHPDVKKLFNKSSQMAIFIDGSGSTTMRDVVDVAQDIIVEASVDGFINVKSISNSRQNAVCPFCQVECCDSLENEESLEAYELFRSMCVEMTEMDYPRCEALTATTTTTTTTTEAPATAACFVAIGSTIMGINYLSSVHTPDTCTAYGCNQPIVESTWQFTSDTNMTFNGEEPASHTTPQTTDLGSIILNSMDSIFVANESSFHIFDNNNVELARFTGPCIITRQLFKSYYTGQDVRNTLSTQSASIGGNWGDYITNSRVFFSEELPTTQGELFLNLPSNTDFHQIHTIASATHVHRFEIRTASCPTTTTTTPNPCISNPCLSEDTLQHVVVIKSQETLEHEDCDDPTAIGFDKYLCTFVWYKREGTVNYYVATRYFTLNGLQEGEVSVSTMPQLQLIMTCDCNNTGHPRWGLSASTNCPEGSVMVHPDVDVIGTNSTPPEWKVIFFQGDCQCMDRCCGYELEFSESTQQYEWTITSDSNTWTTDSSNDEILCWDLSNTTDKQNLYNKFPPSSGIITAEARSAGSSSGYKSLLMLPCADCGCNDKPTTDGTFVDEDNQVGCDSRAIISPPVATNDALCFGDCVYSWDGTEWIKTYEDCDNGAP